MTDQASLKDRGESLNISGHLKNQSMSLITDSPSLCFVNYKRVLMTLQRTEAAEAAWRPLAIPRRMKIHSSRSKKRHRFQPLLLMTKKKRLQNIKL